MDLKTLHLSHLTNAQRETFSACGQNWQHIILSGGALTDQHEDVTCRPCLSKLEAAFI